MNIDDASVVKAMESLGVTAFKRLIHVRKIKRLMHQYINGLVAESETLKVMLSLCRKGTTTEDIEKVLEELCGNLPVERLEALVKLRKQYKVYLLSNINDGAHVRPGDIAFVVEGRVRSLLQTERLMLNIMQRMSGIATMTAKYAAELKGLKTKVLDTRKTTPGLRMLEKEAVKIGGGVNHRIGLFDMILLKDNHVDFAGGIRQAITKANDYIKQNHKDGMKIEIEVRNFDELNQAIETGGIDRIMLDNFTPADTRKAVEIIAGRYETESSGGITFDTLRQYGECGVDYISVGALTHSVKGLDMSFKAC